MTKRHLNPMFLLAALALILMSISTGSAQGPGGRRGQGHPPPTPAIDTALDADGDEVISAQEIADAASVLTVLDIDNDGVLSFEECMGFPPGGNPPQAPLAGSGGSRGMPPAPPVFSVLDVSGDQIVDESEIAGAPSSLLALDDNGDGQLQEDEIRPEHPGGSGGGQNPPR